MARRKRARIVPACTRLRNYAEATPLRMHGHALLPRYGLLPVAGCRGWRAGRKSSVTYGRTIGGDALDHT